MLGPEFLAVLLVNPAAIILVIAMFSFNLGIWNRFASEKHELIASFKHVLFIYLIPLFFLALYSFVSSYIDFSGRVERRTLSEGLRWHTVPGWSVMWFLMLAFFLLPFIGLVVTPCLVTILFAVRKIKANRRQVVG